MALVAMSFFNSNFSFAQATLKAFSPKIKTPSTSKELKESKESKESKPEKDEESAQEKPSPSYPATAGSPRKLQQHGLGLGLGQTFLMGNYGKHGEDQITMDLLYSYAASYSFDILLDAHLSHHKDGDEKMRLMGLTGSFKGRLVEFDNFSPYLLGGLGFYSPKAKRDVISGSKWSEDKITFGLNFGGGLDLRLNEHYVVGVMGQMHSPFTIKQDEGKDLKGYYFKLLITGMYLF